MLLSYAVLLFDPPLKIFLFGNTSTEVANFCLILRKAFFQNIYHFCSSLGCSDFCQEKDQDFQ